MDEITTQVTVNRDMAEVMLGATRAWKTLVMEVPDVFQPGDALKLASAELLLIAAVDRLSYLESKPRDNARSLRDRLPARLAYPAGVKAW